MPIKGKRYTVLISLVERSEHCRLVARVRKRGEAEEIRETRIPMDPGTVALFNGDKLWHAVTPLGKGEERIILTLQYVTNQKMGPLKRSSPISRMHLPTSDLPRCYRGIRLRGKGEPCAGPAARCGELYHRAQGFGVNTDDAYEMVDLRKYSLAVAIRNSLFCEFFLSIGP